MIKLLCFLILIINATLYAAVCTSALLIDCVVLIATIGKIDLKLLERTKEIEI